MDCLRDRGSGRSRLGYGRALSEVTINPTTELPELTQDWEIDSWRAQTEPCTPGHPVVDVTGDGRKL